MLNNVVIMGRLTADPELKTTSSNISLCRFTVACNRSYSRQGEEKKTDFIDVTAWRQTAEFVSRYFYKGSMIAVEGSIRVENYTDKDGNKRKSVYVIANNVSFCGSRNEEKTVPPQGEQPQPSYSSDSGNDFDEIVDDDDDLPF